MEYFTFTVVAAVAMSRWNSREDYVIAGTGIELARDQNT
jgi:hypothetical protein